MKFSVLQDSVLSPLLFLIYINDFNQAIKLCKAHHFTGKVHGYNSNIAAVKFSVPQDSVLSPLLFLIYINDFNQAIKLCKAHHFTGKVHHVTDDINLAHFCKSVNKLNMSISI